MKMPKPPLLSNSCSSSEQKSEEFAKGFERIWFERKKARGSPSPLPHLLKQTNKQKNPTKSEGKPNKREQLGHVKLPESSTLSAHVLVSLLSERFQ